MKRCEFRDTPADRIADYVGAVAVSKRAITTITKEMKSIYFTNSPVSIIIFHLSQFHLYLEM